MNTRSQRRKNSRGKAAGAVQPCPFASGNSITALLSPEQRAKVVPCDLASLTLTLIDEGGAKTLTGTKPNASGVPLAGVDPEVNDLLTSHSLVIVRTIPATTVLKKVGTSQGQLRTAELTRANAEAKADAKFSATMKARCGDHPGYLRNPAIRTGDSGGDPKVKELTAETRERSVTEFFKSLWDKTFRDFIGGDRVVPQDPLEPPRRVVGPVGHNDHAGVLAVAHADPAAVMERDPGRARGRVEEGIEQRPVADRVAAVLHAFRLAIRPGHAAAVEMIAADHDRRADLPIADHLVEREAEPVALAEANPADARGQALERDPLPRQVEPAVQVGIVGDELLHPDIGAINVLGIARQRDPAERADAATEERPDVGGDKARQIERVLDPGVERLLADVVAIIEHRYAERAVTQQRLDMPGH